ncbi:aminoglycoside phosphotransferase family protein [Alloactinosynnema sp. L-07]|uniref:phosphotransferase family protein n=1 Tax=Alloactinosynnema sp. L-07 TaxID=1653480 RepID=UPI00065EF7B0|nr:phosphotransferase [Alloactinosynnema sp. L-07]CRK55958.1 aminoglycoside phosphotransferase family protein [Alloactinosynnema sp. L-07]
MGSDDVRAVLAAHLPDLRVDTVEHLGEGQDNTAFDVNGELIVRFAKGDTDVAAEARLLEVVAGFSPLRIPLPRLVVPELRCLAYDRLPGTQLLDLPECPPGVVDELRGFLDALQVIPVDLVADLVEVDDQDGEGWLADAKDCYAALAVPARFRPVIEAFLAEAPPKPDYEVVFSHNDLGIEHVLIQDGRVSGVIDWTDAALCDPAYDHGLLYRDLGVLPSGRPDGFVERAVFYARCSVLEDWRYGVESGLRQFVTQAQASLEWLFRAE